MGITNLMGITSRIGLVGFLFILILTLLLPAAHADNGDRGFEELTVTLDVADIPLETVAEDIAKQTGYTVVLSETLLSVPVTGSYEQAKVGNLFARILRGKNISILSDDSAKIIVVKLFGDKRLIAKRGVDEERLSKMVPGMDITFKELEEQEELNKLELEEALSDPATLDAFSGMTVDEINELREKNRAELEQRLNDPNTVIPQPQGGGVTVGERQKQEQLNREELEKAINDPDTVDPISGMKMSEVRKLEKENAELLQKKLSDPDTVDPWTGATLRELEERAKSD